MLERNKSIDLIRSHGIRQNTIAVVSEMDPATVCNFIKGIRVSALAEIAIIRAVADVVRIIEKSAPIRPDLSDGTYIKNLIRRIDSIDECCVRCGKPEQVQAN